MSDSTLRDPLGRQITLHDHTWYGHILKGHPEVRHDRAAVQQAVTSPELIQLSTSDPDCRLYYSQPSTTGRMLVVVADVTKGVLKTAYAAKKIKSGATEWSPPKPSKASSTAPSGSTTTPPTTSSTSASAPTAKPPP
jgi:hypothetical protein